MKTHSLKSEQGKLCAAYLKTYWAEILIQDPSSSRIWEILKWKAKRWDTFDKTVSENAHCEPHIFKYFHWLK